MKNIRSKIIGAGLFMCGLITSLISKDFTTLIMFGLFGGIIFMSGEKWV